MRAIGLVRGENSVQTFDLPKPEITQPDEVLVRIKEVGLDGTDYNVVRYGPDMAPDKNRMVMGHEAVGIVEDIGGDVKSLVPGDIVSITVRRGCGICHPCLHNQSDMCMTGLFKERGIHKLDGFLSEYAVDQEQYMVKVPREMKHLAVLTEPVSIAEKGIDQIRIIQSRFPWTCPHPEHDFKSPDWGNCKTGLVVGAGPLGLLAASLLRLAQVNIMVADIVPDSHPKAGLVNYLGAKYVDTSDKSPRELMEYCEVHGGSVDILFEASGAASTALQLISYMARSSIYIMTGIPRDELNLNIDAGQVIRHMVKNNEVVVGSVNSNRSHFEKALLQMTRINLEFPELCQKILTDRVKFNDFQEAFTPKGPKFIKTVIEVDPWD
ncbi:Threonine dehydrogenase [Dehalogenimonas formicexedens]|uniref:Threonine dehydrogenase n=1 Tax=Dehalogenimonas formicexedens TaxID=1839801 RepID=A0A1P8F5G0_9CHLR|nr:alcohol dehydrogenase catalytic domain-containing protein [Dehalogenimonas formicexedens]APV43714.1 Threonine dehydrogenase [Dehalogenimonas formicexedens]